MRWFRCRGCDEKDQALREVGKEYALGIEAAAVTHQNTVTDLEARHARERQEAKAVHAGEVTFLREQVQKLSDKLVALADVRAAVVLQPRPPADPDKQRTPGAHAPSMIRTRRSDRPSEEELRKMRTRLEQPPDAGQPEPGPTAAEIETGFQQEQQA